MMQPTADDSAGLSGEQVQRRHIVLKAVIVGVVTAVRRDKPVDYVATIISYILIALPVFWFAVLLKTFVAIKVNEAMKTAIAALPAELLRTITWDQGREMARHVDFTVDTGIQVYWPRVKNPFTTRTTTMIRRSCVQRNSTGVSTSDAAKYSSTAGLRPNLSRRAEL